MRIGLFTDTYPPFINGVSTSVLMLKKALEAKKHQVYIVTVNHESISYSYDASEKLLRIPSVPAGIYDYRVSGIYPIKAAMMIKKWKLDIIHSHTEFGIGTFARIIAKQYNIPLVHTYHTLYEDFVHYITKGYFDGIGKKIIEYLTYFYCDKTISELVVPTKKTYDLFVKKYKMTRNIHIVPTGIEVEKFYAEHYDKKQLFDIKNKIGLSSKDFVILYVGRVAPEKSIDFLLHEHKYLCKKYPDMKLVIIGDGPDLNDYKDWVKEKRLEKEIFFVGKVPFNEIGLYYQIADVFATASKSETQGLTIVEAMAASVPVVAVNDESFNTVIVNDLNGYCFNNRAEYRDSILSLYQNRPKLRQMGGQARITANTFSNKYFAERMIDVYNYAIQKHKLKKKNIVYKIMEVVGRNE